MSEGPVVVKLKGDTDIVAAFKDLKEYLPKQALRSALRKGANRMYNAVRPHIPQFSGRLLSNIIIKTKKTAATIRARLVVRTTGGRKSQTDSFYWRFLEKGWKSRNGVEHRHPFASRAIEATLNLAAQDVVDAVDKSIDRAEKKARSSRGF